MTRLKVAIALMLAAAGPALAQDDAAELAKKLSNPVAALISVPMQLNFDQDIGAARQGERWSLNLQPVIPMDLDRNWNLISRTIVPVVSQKEIVPGAGSQFGLGDTVQSFFFSPKAPTAGGWIWGAGPVLLLPTGTDDLLSAKKWGAGPTAVVLKQAHGWTYGALGNHLWSFAGDSQRTSISATFVLVWCGVMKGGKTRISSSGWTIEWIALTSRISLRVNGGKMVGIRSANIVFPVPGGPTINTW